MGVDQRKPRIDPRRPVTRDDVARYAGVSSAVVSYVVNSGPRPVAEETAARVRSAIELLGYRPNVSARALKVGSTRMLGLVLGDLENPYFAELAVQTQTAANQAGYAVLISSTDQRRGAVTTRSVLDDLIDRQVDGFLLDSGSASADTLTHLKRHHARVVVFDAPSALPGRPTVGADAAQGARLVVEHLIDTHRHRDIGLVIGDEDRASADAREDGWREALRTAGLPDGPVARVEFSRSGGYEGTRRLLAAATRPTAIFASSDRQGIGALRALHEAGLRIPDDVAVVAYDGTTESEFAWPPLTVARQPVEAMATAAVHTLLSSDQSHELFPMELIVRESCGCVSGEPPAATPPLTVERDVA